MFEEVVDLGLGELVALFCHGCLNPVLDNATWEIWILENSIKDVNVYPDSRDIYTSTFISRPLRLSPSNADVTKQIIHFIRSPLTAFNHVE